MPDFTIKRGDRAPGLQATLQDATGAPVDLTTAQSVRFIMRAPGAVAPKVNAAATFMAPRTSGVVSYSWQTGDTDTPGICEAEWEVTWSNGTLETFPGDSYTEILIIADLDVASPADTIVSLNDVKDHLGITHGKHDTQLRTFIAAATPIIENIVGPVTATTYTETYDGGESEILLRHRPVVSITSVTEYRGNVSYPLTVATDPSQASGAYRFTFDSETGRIFRRSSGQAVPFPIGTGNVTVVYVAQRTPIPENVRLATKELIRHWYQRTQVGGRPAFTGSVAAEEVPNVSQAYAVPWAVEELLAPHRRAPSIA